MERLAMVYRLRPGTRDEYVKAHREIWPQIKKRLGDTGCGEMTIFLHGDLLFFYALIDNIERYNATRSKDPYFHKWASWMDELLVVPFDKDEPSAFARLEEIWRFEA